jgi:hypothetical protein
MVNKHVIVLITCVFYLIFYGIAVIIKLPVMVHGEKDDIGNMKPEGCSSAVYLIFWVIYLKVVTVVLRKYLVYDVYFSPFTYMFLYNVPYVFNIVTNVIGKRTVSDFPGSILINAIYVIYYPFTYYGPTWWVDGYNSQWACTFMVLQAIIVAIITCQIMFGSRFMFPASFRTRVYDKYTKYLKHNSTEIEQQDQ